MRAQEETPPVEIIPELRTRSFQSSPHHCIIGDTTTTTTTSILIAKHTHTRLHTLTCTHDEADDDDERNMVTNEA